MSTQPRSSSQPNGTHENVNTETDTEDAINAVMNGDEREINDSHSFYIPAPAIASSRYSRQLLIPSISLQGQSRISDAKILVVGLGGLGSPAALYLAGAGVDTLGLLDDDVVEQSNLHRQIVHREDSVARGLSKVESAARACRELNGDVKIRVHRMRLGGGSAEVLQVVGEYDVVLDCSDNPATRYLVSDVCVLLSKVLVSGAAQKLEGQLMALNYPASSPAVGENVRGPCYRCVFPQPPAPEMVKNCGEIGILGPVVGTIGSLMASEALRLIVKAGQEERKPSMLLYNAWPADPRSMFRSVGLRGRRKDCLACGDEDVLKEKGLQRITEADIVSGGMDYMDFCGVPEDIRVLRDEERMSAAEFLDRLASSNKAASDNTRIIDVREQHEVELGPKITHSINVPLSKILRTEVRAETKNGNRPEPNSKFEDLFKVKNAKTILFICPQGNDSQTAARRLTDYFKDVGTEHKAFIGDVTGGFLAVEKVLKSKEGRPAS